jgi:hypothetical protein
MELGEVLSFGGGWGLGKKGREGVDGWKEKNGEKRGGEGWRREKPTPKRT